MWVNLPNFDLHMWCTIAFSKIVSLIMTLVYTVTFATLSDKVLYARLLVKVDA